MPLDLTTVFENLNDIKRNLFYNEGLTLRFMNRNTLLLEIDHGWYMQKDPSSSIADKAFSGGSVGTEEFFECSIALDDEDINLETIISLSTSIEIGEEKFVAKGYVKPRQATKKWNLRLVTLGKK